MRQYPFVIFLWLMIPGGLLAQPAAYPQLTLKASEMKGSRVNEKYGSFLGAKKDSTATATAPLPIPLPLNFYSQHLGAACKMELQLEKQTKLPIRIRLGSKEQVDYLEGKFSRNR